METPVKHETYIVKIEHKDGNVCESLGQWDGEYWYMMQPSYEYQNIDGTFEHYDWKVLSFREIPYKC